MQIIGRQTAQHYTWGNDCDGWHLVQSTALSVIEEQMPPGASEIRHYHRKATQFFYVLQGSLSVEVEGDELALSSGEGILITAGQAHQVRNRSATDVKFLVISNPPSHGDRVSAELAP
jgi:mannose-6-phosphate isomerase-like protein (cupin superfamily)